MYRNTPNLLNLEQIAIRKLDESASEFTEARAKLNLAKLAKLEKRIKYLIVLVAHFEETSSEVA